jgi:superfamily II DNA or RNA helicase
VTHPEEALADIELRRREIASWIQDAVKPVEHTLRDGTDTNELAAVGFTDSKAGAETPEFEVRGYQLDAWGALWDARQSGASRGLIHLATGLGKTSVGVFDTMKFREEFRAQYGRDPKIMFTVHQNDILKQAAERFQIFMPDATIGFYNGDTKNLDSDITFATLQSLHANLNQFDRKTFDYIINDEVHHVKAHTYEKVIKYFKPSFRLGLTATPNRKDEKDIRELYGDELYSKGLAEALAEDWLASPDYHIVFDDVVKEAIRSGFQVTTLAALQELFKVQPRNEVISKNIKDEMGRLGLEFGSVKTIVFCQNIEHAEEMAKLLNGRAYHSNADHDDRNQVFDDFKNGDLQVITTRDMFNEGVDIPDARLLVFLRSTSSQTLFEQQLGRGLRKTKDKERVSVLDFVANVERIVMVKKLAESASGRSTGRGSPVNPDSTDKGNDIIFGSETESTNHGITIHTNHGDFDFDIMTINLLEKYKDLLSNKIERVDWAEWTNEQIVSHALSLKTDGPLSYLEIDELSKEGRFLSGPTIKKRFGSIFNFIEACGFTQISWDDASDEDLIAKALELSSDTALSQRVIKKLPREIFPAPGYIERRYGSLLKFQEMCGFAVKKTGIDQDGIVAQALAISPTKPLTTSEISELSKERKLPSLPTIIDRFGSLDAFYEACGFEKRNWAKLSNEELISRALELSPDAPLTYSQLKTLVSEDKFVHESTLVKRFGSLQKFQQASGFNITKRHWGSLSNKDLIELANKLSPNERLGVVAIDHLSRNDFPSSPTIRKRFGSMDEWHKARGL